LAAGPVTARRESQRHDDDHDDPPHAATVGGHTTPDHETTANGTSEWARDSGAEMDPVTRAYAYGIAPEWWTAR